MGEVTVVAPVAEQSGVGHAITYLSPIAAERVTLDGGEGGYALRGTPADCVKFGILELFDQRPDLVISGINLGWNLGLNVFYSGTVAAAVEGAMNGIMSAAFSTSRSNAGSLSRAAGHCAGVLRMLLGAGRRGALAYNVNTPVLADGEPEVVFTHHRGTPFPERYLPQRGDGGRTYHQLDLAVDAQDAPADECDVHAVRRGMISVTPLRASLTDTDSLRRLAGPRAERIPEPT